MNNESNNLNNESVTTTPVANKFMTVNDVNQINQTENTVTTTPTVEPQVATPVVDSVPSTEVPTVSQTNASVEATEVPTVPQTTASVETTEVPTVQQAVDNNAIINENLQKVEIKNYTPPSKFKIFLLFLFFTLLVVFIVFLPNISSMVRIYMNGNNEPVNEVISSGKLICTLNTNTADLDKEYEFEYGFTDSKLKSTKYVVYTRGDTTTETLLDDLAETCKKLQTHTDDIDGVTVKCEYSDGKLMEKQIFELETLDVEKLDAAYTEAGGITLSARYDQEIDSIESNMKASGYTCERRR